MVTKVIAGSWLLEEIPAALAIDKKNCKFHGMQQTEIYFQEFSTHLNPVGRGRKDALRV